MIIGSTYGPVSWSLILVKDKIFISYINFSNNSKNQRRQKASPSMDDNPTAFSSYLKLEHSSGLQMIYVTNYQSESDNLLTAHHK